MVWSIILLCIISPTVYSVPIHQHAKYPQVELEQDETTEVYRIKINTPDFERVEEVYKDGTIFGEYKYKTDDEYQFIDYIVNKDLFFVTGDSPQGTKAHNEKEKLPQQGVDPLFKKPHIFSYKPADNNNLRSEDDHGEEGVLVFEEKYTKTDTLTTLDKNGDVDQIFETGTEVDDKDFILTNEIDSDDDVWENESEVKTYTGFLDTSEDNNLHRKSNEKKEKGQEKYPSKRYIDDQIINTNPFGHRSILDSESLENLEVSENKQKEQVDSPQQSQSAISEYDTKQRIVPFGPRNTRSENSSEVVWNLVRGKKRADKIDNDGELVVEDVPSSTDNVSVTIPNIQSVDVGLTSADIVNKSKI